MNRPEMAARNTDYIGYSTPNYKAMELLPEDIINSKVAILLMRKWEMWKYLKIKGYHQSI